MNINKSIGRIQNVALWQFEGQRAVLTREEQEWLCAALRDVVESVHCRWMERRRQETEALRNARDLI